MKGDSLHLFFSLERYKYEYYFYKRDQDVFYRMKVSYPNLL